MAHDRAPNGTWCVSCKPLAFQGGERDLCPSRGSLRLIKVKGFSAPFGWFSARCPIAPRMCVNGRSPCSVNMSLM